MAATRQAPYTSVLCPVDFSAQAGAALRYAATLAKRSHGRLHVLFVNDPLLVAAAAAAYNTRTLGETSAVELRRFVRSVLPPRATRGVTLVCENALGKPAQEILRAARRLSPELIVLGTKGLNAAQRLLLGSTTTAVLRKTTVPVLAVPPMPEGLGSQYPVSDWPGGEILAPLALGTHAVSDLLRAADIARRFHSSLRIVHAVAPPAAPAWLHTEAEAHARIRKAKAVATLERLRTSLKGVNVVLDVRLGHPADEIAAVAAEQRTGLIVMTLRGRGGLFGDAAGVVAYHVLSHAVAPVLALPVVRAPERQR